MPVSGSGVMLEVYSVPNGVGMARPPANRRPSGAVWQAVQSPARARYSPRAMMSPVLSLSCAAAAVVNAAMASNLMDRSLIDNLKPTSASSVGLATAAEWQRIGAFRHGGWVRGGRPRRKPGCDGGDVPLGHVTGYELHAIRGFRGASAITPAAELGADVIGAQAEQAGDAGLHTRQSRAMTAHASRNVAAGIAAGGEQLTVREDVLADFARRRRWKRRVLTGKIFRHRLQVGIGQEFQQIVHWWVFAPAATESEELVVEITGRLACETREVDVAGAFALVAMTGRAGLHPRRHRIRRLVSGLCGRTIKGAQDGNGDCRSSEASEHAVALQKTGPG